MNTFEGGSDRIREVTAMPIDWVRVREQLCKHPSTVAPNGGDEALIRAAEAALGCRFAPGYRAYLREIGGAIIGSDPVFGVVKADDMGTLWSVTDVTRWFRAEGWEGVARWYVVSTDGRGNPVGVDSAGRVWMSDHDVRDVIPVAESFEAFVEMKLED